MDLKELIPLDTKVKLNGKEYELRKLNAEDEAWIQNIVGEGDALQTALQKMDMSVISKILFRQLKDKSDFLPIKEQGHDDDGNPVEVFVSGPKMVLRSIVGVEQKLEVYYAIMETIGVSRAQLDKLTEQEMKKLEAKEKIEADEAKKKGVKPKAKKK